jgi:hypothetical protein
VATATGEFTDDQGNTANPEADDTTPVDVVAAAIAIDKQPDSVQLLANGAASFTLVVTNAGDVPLSNVVVADAQCDAAPAFQGGDDNGDGILDLGETWTYTCSIADVGTVGFDNVATATGEFTDDQGNTANPATTWPPPLVSSLTIRATPPTPKLTTPPRSTWWPPPSRLIRPPTAGTALRSSRALR